MENISTLMGIQRNTVKILDDGATGFLLWYKTTARLNYKD